MVRTVRRCTRTIVRLGNLLELAYGAIWLIAFADIYTGIYTKTVCEEWVGN